jgi:hypothetical protein
MAKRVSEKNVVMSSGAAAVPARRKSAPKRTTRATEVETPVVSEVVSEVAATGETLVEVSQEAVAQLAYSYWEARGYQGGSSEEDWLRAEQELRASAATK